MSYAMQPLDEGQVNEFLTLLRLEYPRRLGIDWIRKLLISFFESVPFQNITMLIGPRARPTWDQICADMLSGNGGLCTTRNPFMKALLEAVGYDVEFVSASMVKPDCHIGLIVTISEQQFWIDVGNGYPYVEPYLLGSGAIVSHPFFDYRIKQVGPMHMVEHRFNDGEWKMNQSFELSFVPYEFFDEMHHHHYTDVGWGPFLTGLRLNCWSMDGGSILRDRKGTVMGESTTICNLEELKTWIQSVFPMAPFAHQDIIQQAWQQFCQIEQEMKT